MDDARCAPTADDWRRVAFENLADVEAEAARADAAVDLFITAAVERGIIPMGVAADLSQYLVEEWSA